MASVLLKSCQNLQVLCRSGVASKIAATLNGAHPTILTALQPVRNSSFRSSEPLGNISANHPQVEVVRNAPEWKYVQAILAKPIVPEPTKKSEYPSGWQPQADNLEALAYFVPRTKNHMHPVYLVSTYRGTRRITKLRRVQGDIWKLEKELHEAIEARIGKHIVTRVNEMSGQIWFKGDYVNIVKEYLNSKGL